MDIEGLTPGPLPSPQEVHTRFRAADHESAYAHVYNAQQGVLTDEARVIQLGVLGYLILVAPDDVVRAEIVLTIISCKNYQALFELGKAFIDFFIRPCKSPFPFSSRQTHHALYVVKRYNECSTPDLSSDSSRASFNTRQEEIKAQIHEAPQSLQQAKDQVSLTFLPLLPCPT